MDITAVVDTNAVTPGAKQRTISLFPGEQLTPLGIYPPKVKDMAVKGAVAWCAAYGDVAAEIIELDLRLFVNPPVGDRTKEQTM